MLTERTDIRNIAIIAHVDHGKTTLVDGFLKQARVFRANQNVAERVMDSNDLERERGITILSKNTAITIEDPKTKQQVKINIVDTPGHADFGGEVERILNMVDGVLLLVDAAEGPMPQTKFVLKKSLALHLKPIVVINKIDRPNSRPHEIVDQTFDLFGELNATDEQLDFPIVFASGKEGRATLDLDDEAVDMKPLMDTIIHRVLPPVADPDQPFQMLVTILDYDSYIGRIAVGRIVHGEVRTADPVTLVKRGGEIVRAKVTKILAYQGLARVERDYAQAGDIISLAGIADVRVGETITSPEHPVALPTVNIDEPTISMNFSHNTSPLSGKDGGRFLTSRHIRERLAHEAMMNVGIKVEEADGGERFTVSGRGELHLAILIETMRREGYELEVSPPKVIFKHIDGEVLEPVEEVVIEVDAGYQGAVIEALGNRRGDMRNMQVSTVGTIRMEFLVASRALMGFRNELLMMTHGTAIMSQIFFEYQPFKGEVPQRSVGVQISTFDNFGNISQKLPKNSGAVNILSFQNICTCVGNV